MKYCRFCGQQITATDEFCFKCGKVQTNDMSAGIVNNAVHDKVASSVGKTCPFCQFIIKPTEKTVVCNQCGMAHHEECWNENENKCTTFGCCGVQKNLFITKIATETMNPTDVKVYYSRGTVNDILGEKSQANMKNFILILGVFGLFAVIMVVIMVRF